MEVKRLFDIPYYQLENFPQEDSLCGKVDGKWVKTSSKSFVDQAMMVSKALVESGIEPNDKVGIISNNRPEWNIVDVGIQMCGGISVPIYPTISAKDYEYIFNDASVKLCFVSSADLLEKVNEVKANAPSLGLIISFEKIDGIEHFSEFKSRGEKTPTEAIETRKAAIKSEQLATLIYTSGTTGNPKGVMLSHNNIVSNVIGSRERFLVMKMLEQLVFFHYAMFMNEWCSTFLCTLEYLFITQSQWRQLETTLERFNLRCSRLCPDYWKKCLTE